MTIIDLIQGSEEWREFRAQNYNASECAAMLGLDQKISREELLRVKATGDEPEFTPFQLGLFADGHKAEKEFREKLEMELCENLPPLVAIHYVDEFASAHRVMGASLDGAYIGHHDGRVIWFIEHKLWNQELVNHIQTLGTIPDKYMAQVQHQFIVFKNAEECEFVVSDGADKEIRIRIYPDEAWHDRILAGWIQFDEDLERWAPAPPTIVLRASHEPDMHLPIVRIDLQGRVLTTNASGVLAIVTEKLRLIPGENELNALSNPDEIDQFFANAVELVKNLKAYEDSLAARKKACIEQLEEVNKEFEFIDQIAAKVRSARLTQEFIAKTGKQNKRNEIYSAGIAAWDQFVRDIEETLQGHKLGVNRPDLSAAMRGKKTQKSCLEAVKQSLANGKIEAGRVVDTMLANLSFWSVHKQFSVPDLSSLLHLESEAFQGVINKRYQEMLASKWTSPISTGLNTGVETADAVSTPNQLPPDYVVRNEDSIPYYVWLPMESAPKDMRILLAYDFSGGSNVMAGQWLVESDSKRGPKEYWLPDLWRDIGLAACKKTNPAKWMRLPEYP